ncbi:MAG: DUF924 family protein [Candidatus Binatia bacterium]
MNIECILDFWFGTHLDDAVIAKEQAELWWSKNRETDDKISRRFEASVRAAAAGELNAWRATARGRLAFIILTDQFPRNIYRDTARAFSCDSKALTWCLEGLHGRSDRELRPIERVFFYLPLEHAESREHQAKSVECLTELVASVPMEQRSTFEEYLNFAMRHRDIIDRFGRFPHRNNILGRESTAEELAFLTERGSGF